MLHQADGGSIAGLVRADGAQITLAQVAAIDAGLHETFRFGQGLAEFLCQLRFFDKQSQDYAFGRSIAEARQTFESVQKFLEGGRHVLT